MGVGKVMTQIKELHTCLRHSGQGNGLWILLWPSETPSVGLETAGIIQLLGSEASSWFPWWESLICWSLGFETLLECVLHLRPASTYHHAWNLRLQAFLSSGASGGLKYTSFTGLSRLVTQDYFSPNLSEGIWGNSPMALEGSTNYHIC